MKGFHPSAAEVYCIRCPECGVEWALRWPPPVGQVSSACGHLACYRSTNGRVTVYETGDCAPLQAQREDDARDDGAPGPEQVPGPPRPPR